MTRSWIPQFLEALDDGRERTRLTEILAGAGFLTRSDLTAVERGLIRSGAIRGPAY